LTLVIFNVILKYERFPEIHRYYLERMVSMKFSKSKLMAALLACTTMMYPVSVLKASATEEYRLNLHDEATMTEEEKHIKEYCDIAINTVNNIRVQYGLQEVKTFGLLNEATCVRAMETKEFYGHKRPDGSECWSVLAEYKIQRNGGAENIAAGRDNPVDTVDQWMNSEGHRKNILDKKFSHIGIGYYKSDDPEDPYEHYWSMFLICNYEAGIAKSYENDYYPTRDLGDADGSHTINANDSAMILTYAANLSAGVDYPVVHDFAEAADVNGDGSVDAVDASVILAYSADYNAGITDAQLTDYIW